ncbi:MAG: YdcF family protein [Ruminococcus sp.]|nr:YdcF family protein [Ruminococcus sp.]
MMKKLKPRYLFFIISVVLITLCYSIYLFFVGSTYSVYIGYSGDVDLSTVSVEFSDNDVVRVNNIDKNRVDSLYSELVRVDVSSIGTGEVNMKISFTEDRSKASEMNVKDNRQENIRLLVLPSGFIYNATYNNFNGLWESVIAQLAVLLVIVITSVISFKEKLKLGQFSYGMVTLGGAIIFCVITFVSWVMTLWLDSDISVLIRAKDLLENLCDSAKAFLILTFLPLLIFAFTLSISNILLVIHEGFRPRNLLGFLLGIFIVFSVVGIYITSRFSASGSQINKYMFTVITVEMEYLFCYFECMLLSTVICAIISTKHKIKTPLDYLIILGCAIRRDGSPTPLLKGRVDKAIEFDRMQNESFSHYAKFVPSGGQGSDEVVSEAESMKRYLVEQGIPEDRILKEDKSVNTYQNMAFSKKIIENDTDDIGNKRIGFSTTNYHVFRGYTLAKIVKMKVEGLSAKTKHYFYPNAFLREFIGLLWNQKIRHIVFTIISTVVLSIFYFVLRY